MTGCEDKKSNLSKEHVKTETAKSVKQSQQKDNNKTEDNKSGNNTGEEQDLAEPKYTYTLSDMNDINHTVTIENKYIEISNVTENIIVLNFFATWCPPCKGEIPYLVDLQKKYEGKLFMAGVLVNDTPDKEALESFLKAYAINYFVSTGSQNDDLAKLAREKLHLPEDLPLPLTILFKDGHYYSHYEGAVPVEMLEYDIKNAMSKE